ncbi:MAG: anti-sigma factor [Paracoccaceae bacterium]
MSDPRDPLEDDAPDAILAAEYVLGSLPLAERLAAENRLKTDAGFAARVAAWETHFAPLNDEYAEVPAPDLLPKIEARLFGAAPPAPRRRFWPRFVLGAGVAAALVVAVLVSLPLIQGPAMVATLTAEAQPLVFDASYRNGTLDLVQTAGPAAAADKAYELWVIVGDAAPVSLGVLEAPQISRAVPDLPIGAVLAISLEPTGGSTTGAPTGPVLVTGVITDA